MKMTSSLILCILALAANAAHADFEPFAKDQDGQQLFVDKSSIVRDGRLTRIWTGLNYARPRNIDGTIARSSKVQVELDCQGGRIHFVHTVYYPELDAQGRVILSEPTLDPWSPIIPGSVGDTTRKLLCK